MHWKAGGHMKGQISTAVRRLMKKSPTLSSRAERGICFCLSSSVGWLLAVVVILCYLVGIVPYLAITQDQSGVEDAPQQAPLTGVTSSTQNPLQVALLHWYDANLTTTFRVGSSPRGVTFDGVNIWVVNNGS